MIEPDTYALIKMGDELYEVEGYAQGYQIDNEAGGLLHVRLDITVLPEGFKRKDPVDG